MKNTMNAKPVYLSFALAAAVLLQGCAGAPSGNPLKDNPHRIVPIHKNGPENVQYKKIETINVTFERATIFDRNPNIEDVNLMLQDEARRLGADAVINVAYEHLMDEQNWSYIKASGEAIAFIRR